MSMQQKNKISDEVVCRTCGTTKSELEGTLYAGCADCYKHLRETILYLADRMQGTRRHTGEAPLASSPEIDRLKKEYERAIMVGRFDDAEKLAAEIRALGGKPV